MSTSHIRLVSVDGTATGTFTLTAEGGEVPDYSITVGPALVGSLTVSPSSGSLAPGASVTITVTTTSLVAARGKVTVTPGAHQVIVIIAIGVSPGARGNRCRNGWPGSGGAVVEGECRSHRLASARSVALTASWAEEGRPRCEVDAAGRVRGANVAGRRLTGPVQGF